MSNENKINQLSKSALNDCSELYKNYFKHQYDSKNASVKSNLIKFIPVELLRPVTASKYQKYSPLFTNHKGICRLQTFIIPIDCLVLVDLNTSLNNLYEIILEKLNLHLQAVKQCFIAHYQNENYFKPETFHFLIDNQNLNNLILTCVYPSNKTDDNLISIRKEIHASLDLPLDRPILRRIDKFNFEFVSNGSDDLSSKYLLNPHTSVKPSNLTNSKQTLVFGNYYYFHYMQDNFNDNGWGCAYR